MSGVGPALGRCCRFASASLGLRPRAAALCRCAVVPAAGALRVCVCPALLRWRAASVLLGARFASVLGLASAWPRSPCFRLCFRFRACACPCVSRSCLCPSRPSALCFLVSSVLCRLCSSRLRFVFVFFLLAVRPAPVVFRLRAPRRRSACPSLSPSPLLFRPCSSLPPASACLGRNFFRST